MHGDLERGDGSLARARMRLLAQHPAARLARDAERAANLGERLRAGARRGVERRAARVAELARTLHAVSPLATLDRGYAILFERASGRIVRTVAQAPAGAALRARVADGMIALRVEPD